MRTQLGTIAIAALLLAGCSSAPSSSPSSSPDESLAGEWVLQSGSDAAGDFDLKDSTSTLTLTGATIGGRTACNIFGATVDGGIGDITITPTFQTEAACADATLMQLESRYLDSLTVVTEASISAEVLTLTGPDVALEFSLSPPVPTSKLTGTAWRLESVIDGDSAASVSGDGGILFATDGSLTGSAGCSDFTASWEVNEGTVTIEKFTLEDADCPDEFQTQEEVVASVIGDGFTAVVEGDQLTLTPLDGDFALVYRDDRSSQA
jgi:heat shock protein HslJ